MCTKALQACLPKLKWRCDCITQEYSRITPVASTSSLKTFSALVLMCIRSHSFSLGIGGVYKVVSKEVSLACF